MGGCRCTYRNCTVKSDGKTHMFHYPVFEKVRCHQWLINAHRLEFLNLKVSQLKNRVVCQHHFKDENFMNFKKDKLTFDAIPTEAGPYCDTTNYIDLNLVSSKLFSIIIDDIENDYIMGNDKKANYSMKYGDFLANLELMDIEKIDDEDINYKTSNHRADISSPPKKKAEKETDGSYVLNIPVQDKSDIKYLPHPTCVVSPHKIASNVVLNDIQSYQLDKSIEKYVCINAKQNNLLNNTTGIIDSYQQQQATQKREPKIKIISEKKITNPVTVTGKFKPVSPSFVLNISKSRLQNNATFENLENKTCRTIEYEVPRGQDTIKRFDIAVMPLIKEEDTPKSIQDPPINLFKESVWSEKPCKMSPLKPKVPPERFEAINKKRKFNMKLRDMIESCLDKLENTDKGNKQIKPTENTKPKMNKRRVNYETSRSKTNPVLVTQDYTIAFLEARMRKMENTLLEKIDQNSKKIIDLKETFKNTPNVNKAAYLDGREIAKSSNINKALLSETEEETRKKQLFQEISKYLSPNSKILVYEELFINKQDLSEEKISPKRKRRRYK